MLNFKQNHKKYKPTPTIIVKKLKFSFQKNHSLKEIPHKR